MTATVVLDRPVTAGPSTGSSTGSTVTGTVGSSTTVTAAPVLTALRTAGPPTGWWPRLGKRVADVAATLIGVVVLLPMVLGIALAVKLRDGGPVLFRQTRIGRHGVPFTIYKFRTMVVDAEALLPALLPTNQSARHLFKLVHDPRVTPVGRVLRKLSLDELPQLINVLDGTMSLVGPRPHLADEIARLPHEARRRAEVRPGLTGLWQVSGRSNLDEEQSVRLDLAYVDGCSLGLDLAVLRRTPAAVLCARGAH